MSVLNKAKTKEEAHSKLLKYHQCVWCGKMFYIRSSDHWRYKEYFKGKQYYLCSWGCLQNTRKNTTVKTSDTGMISYGAPKGTWKRTEEVGK